MSFEKDDHVTTASPVPADRLPPFGVVTGHGTCPFSGEELIMVRWDGSQRATPHRPSKLAYVD
ncbi:hypothetical protein ACQPZG_20480 [Streptomyces sp. CA-294286]|uniref:hypothetical protein n=1 Tax=Streptomyces sp. CA-294286 TaxID=3240070 RepID=UPI003D8E5779